MTDYTTGTTRMNEVASCMRQEQRSSVAHAVALSMCILQHKFSLHKYDTPLEQAVLETLTNSAQSRQTVEVVRRGMHLFQDSDIRGQVIETLGRNSVEGDVELVRNLPQ